MNKSGKTITVVTVCYNASKTIEDTIHSILGQDYPNLEYIIVDGQSSDDTMEIVKKYSLSENGFEHKISKWVSEPDSGIYDAMNKGLHMASGNYLIFMGADDVFVNNHVLSDVAPWLDKYDGDIIYGYVRRTSTDCIDSKTFYPFRFVPGNICHQCIFYPREIYSNFQYDTKYPILADYAYNLTVRKQSRFQHIPLMVSIFNDTGISGRCVDREFEKDKRGLLLSSIGWPNYLLGKAYKFGMTVKSRIKGLLKK